MAIETGSKLQEQAIPWLLISAVYQQLGFDALMAYALALLPFCHKLFSVHSFRSMLLGVSAV